MKRLSAVLPLFLAAALAGLTSTPRAEAPGSALAPPSTGGVLLLDPLLKKLSAHRRLLVIGAHPDDENTALLTLVSRKMGGEVAYLSLSRGEGGQNLIGDELGVGLGLIRSQELVAARGLDGGRQFFTRAYDFGFTRSLPETFARWPKEALLQDAVRVVRRFRPQVIYSVFTGTDKDGHGQHQAAGITAGEVFRVAGDSKAFPELAREGLVPWKPVSLYRSTWFDREATTNLSLPTGEVDPLTGRSYHQIAMASRSLHRSQDMGSLQAPGPNETGAAWVAGGEGVAARDLFAGADTRLAGIASGVADPARRKTIEAHLSRVAARAEDTRARLAPANLAGAAPAIASLLADLRAARALVTENGEVSVAELLDEKIAYAEEALAAAAGVALDALGDRETLAPAERLEVTVSVWNAGNSGASVERVWLASPDGWKIGEEAAQAREVAAGTLGEWKLSAAPPAGARPTFPYFLEKPRNGDLYDWSSAAPEVRGVPFQPGPLRAAVTVSIGGTRVEIARDVVYRFRDQAVGEVRRPVRAVPVIEAFVEPDLLVWPTRQSSPERFEVTVVSNTDQPRKGRLELVPPPGWPAAPPLLFAFSKRRENAFLPVSLRPPANISAGRHPLRVSAVLDTGERFDLGIRVLDYSHIPPTPMPEKAELVVSAADIRLPPLRLVAYVRGASDRVPELLAPLGVPLEVLNGGELDSADFSRYDAVVVGSRAYETEPALARANGRLLDYARNGGLVIVQYQQYAFVEGNFAPAKIEIARPHGRVTDETAKVETLDPAHPVFRAPNAIGEEDWKGWVQERGLYFAQSWDPLYTPLLAMSDPGGPEQRGALLVARLGKGHYVYTGLAFFRQLPAGVPGAYRLFANLLGLKGARPTASR